jgi:hypothetical protein
MNSAGTKKFTRSIWHELCSDWGMKLAPKTRCPEWTVIKRGECLSASGQLLPMGGQ